MKKIRTRVAYELEIPDQWKVLPPSEDETEGLMIDGKFYQPAITWLEYKGKDAEGCETWESADDDTQNLIFDHIRNQIECSIRQIKKFSAP
jgi:hypothetical protein